MKICEVCLSENLETVLDLGKHPMCDDLIPIGSNRLNKEFPIIIALCTNCFTAHQLHQVEKEILFPRTYHYRSRFTKDVLTGMEGLVENVEAQLKELSGKKVLDIGCNDGSLLDFFKAKKARTFGIEPTSAANDACCEAHEIFNDYISPELAKKIINIHGQMDIITFTNVFAHIENLDELLKSISLLMHDKTLLVIENHYLGSVLALRQFDTFYHEHPRTYSLHSFEFIAKRLNRKIILAEFPERYGGNIRVFISKENIVSVSSRQISAELLAKEKHFKEDFSALRAFIDEWKLEKRAEIEKLVKLHGSIPAKAFPGRAAILVKMLDLTTNEISSVYEKPGSKKIGNYVPGTQIKIKSDDDIKYDDEELILNLAWHIEAEIRAYLQSKGFEGKIVNIL